MQNIFFHRDRSAEDMVCYSNESVPVTSDSIEHAVDWLWKLSRIAPVSTTATCEAVVKAMNDPQVSRQRVFAVCIYRLVMISIDLSETAQKAHWKSVTMSKPNFFLTIFFF